MFNLFFEDDFYGYVNRIYDKIEEFFLRGNSITP